MTLLMLLLILKLALVLWKSIGNSLVTIQSLTQLLGPLCLWQCLWLELHYCSHLKQFFATKLRTAKPAFQSLGRNNLKRSKKLYGLGKCFQSLSLSLSLSWCLLTIFTCCFEAASVWKPRNPKLVNPPPSHPSSWQTIAILAKKKTSSVQSFGIFWMFLRYEWQWVEPSLIANIRRSVR